MIMIILGPFLDVSSFHDFWNQRRNHHPAVLIQLPNYRLPNANASREEMILGDRGPYKYKLSV